MEISAIIQQALGIFIAVIQVAVVAAMGGAFKTYLEVRDLRKDLNHAFMKIRRLENGNVRGNDSKDGCKADDRGVSK